MGEENVVSRGGSRIVRHGKRRVPATRVEGDLDRIVAISRHIEESVGPVDNVIHELSSDLVHIDIHIAEPTVERPWTMLVTSGMSQVMMTVPEDTGLEEAYAELCLGLPPDWPLTRAELADMQHGWPLACLSELARFPHVHDTFLGFGHSVTNGDPPRPVAPGIGFCGFVLLPPVAVTSEFCELRISPNILVQFHAVYPLYADEMEFFLENGVDELMERFARHRVTEILDVNRPSVVTRTRR